MREAVGRIRCPHHHRAHFAEVRRDRRKRLYLFCPDTRHTAGCGVLLGSGAGYQVWILKTAELYGAKDHAKEKLDRRRAA